MFITDQYENIFEAPVNTERGMQFNLDVNWIVLFGSSHKINLTHLSLAFFVFDGSITLSVLWWLSMWHTYQLLFSHHFEQSHKVVFLIYLSSIHPVLSFKDLHVKMCLQYTPRDTHHIILALNGNWTLAHQNNCIHICKNLSCIYVCLVRDSM